MQSVTVTEEEHDAVEDAEVDSEFDGVGVSDQVGFPSYPNLVQRQRIFQRNERLPT